MPRVDIRDELCEYIKSTQVQQGLNSSQMFKIETNPKTKSLIRKEQKPHTKSMTCGDIHADLLWYVVVLHAK